VTIWNEQAERLNPKRPALPQFSDVIEAEVVMEALPCSAPQQICQTA
jgi:hypothetical protein